MASLSSAFSHPPPPHSRLSSKQVPSYFYTFPVCDTLSSEFLAGVWVGGNLLVQGHLINGSTNEENDSFFLQHTLFKILQPCL